MSSVCVIIPYYQREPGILRRALDSVFAQTYGDIDVVIVDDQSPHPVSAELDGLATGQLSRIRVIRRPNGGPAAARNTGLSHVAPQSAYVAFLDSDDVWHRDHLSIAVNAMTRFDGSCYFSSIEGGEEFGYHFNVSAVAEHASVQKLSLAPPIFGVDDLAALMLEDWAFLHLSCLVMTRKLAATLRFDASLRLAAEDVLFFCDCSLATKRILLSAATGASRGKGVNIFHGVTSDDRCFIAQQFSTLLALSRLETRLAGRDDLARSLREHKHRVRQLALWSFMRRLRAGKLSAFMPILRWLTKDPALLVSAFGLAHAKATSLLDPRPSILANDAAVGSKTELDYGQLGNGNEPASPDLRSQTG